MRVETSDFRMDVGDEWAFIEPLATDPEGTTIVGYNCPASAGSVLMYPISDEQAMPFEQNALLDGVRGFLPDTMAIIAVETGVLGSGNRFLYTLLKQRTEESTINYVLTAQVALDQLYEFSGVFQEQGTTGARDTVAFVLYKQGLKSGQIAEEQSPFYFDPYDKSVFGNIEGNDVFLMHKGETEQTDLAFPEHPLSMARKFVRESIMRIEPV